MPDMQYETDELRQAARQSDDGAQSAHGAANTLRGSGAGSPFGQVNGADSLHGAVQSAKDHHATNASTSSQNLSTAARRAGKTADLGDDLTTDSTKIAPHTASG